MLPRHEHTVAHSTSASEIIQMPALSLDDGLRLRRRPIEDFCNTTPQKRSFHTAHCVDVIVESRATTAAIFSLAMAFLHGSSGHCAREAAQSKSSDVTMELFAS
jgi:hypothetical protein